MERCFNKLIYSINKFRYFITLTFVDKSSGYYPITDRFLEKKLRRWLKKPNGVRYAYDHKLSLFTIHNIVRYIHHKDNSISKISPMITGYVRNFLNKVNMISKRKFGKTATFTYFWKFELGGQTRRPHIHMLLDHPYMHYRGIWRLFEDKWRSGYVDLEPITDRKKAINYLSKYVSKNDVAEYSPFCPIGKHRYSSSRDIPKRPKNPDYVYFTTVDFLETVESFITNYYYDEGSGLFEFLSSPIHS